MSKRADPKLIGGFVIGAVVLAIAGIMFFGSGGLFAEKQPYVLYFEGSVKGLNVGAPVMFRGVKIGTVTDISVRVNPKEYSFRIPVVIEIETNRIKATDQEDAGIFAKLTQGNSINMLIDKGLRAQLQMQSLVTGQLFVQFDMFPDTPVVLHGGGSDYTELPTIPSGLQELTNTFEKIPIEEVAQKLISTLDGLQELVHSADLQLSFYQLKQLLGETRQLVENLNTALPPLMQRADAAIGAVEQGAKHIDEAVGPMVDDIRTASHDVSTTLARADAAMATLQRSLAADSPLHYRLNLTLDEFNRAARSLRELADELQRHPEALLRGKPNPADQQGDH